MKSRSQVAGGGWQAELGRREFLTRTAGVAAAVGFSGLPRPARACAYAVEAMKRNEI